MKIKISNSEIQTEAITDFLPLIQEGTQIEIGGEKVGELIKQVRKAKGLSQNQLSELTGFMQNNISLHESSTNIGENRLAVLLEKMGFSVSIRTEKMYYITIESIQNGSHEEKTQE